MDISIALDPWHIITIASAIGSYALMQVLGD